MLETNCSSIEYRYNKLGDHFNKKKEENKYIFPMFYNKFLASSKQLKLCTRDIIFPIKQEDLYVITIPGVLCLVDWFLTIS